MVLFGNLDEIYRESWTGTWQRTAKSESSPRGRPSSTKSQTQRKEVLAQCDSVGTHCPEFVVKALC
eukprot:6297966-Amphidinium_carterae.1